MNDPYLTEINLRACIYTPNKDEMIALGSALQKSSHVTTLYFDASKLTSIEVCSTMEEYLKSTKCLQTLEINYSLDPSSSLTQQRIRMAKVTDQVLLALREND
jgi:hypothetical protein